MKINNKPDLYIPIKNGTRESSIQLISTKRMLELKKFIPTLKQILDDLAIQRALLKKNPNFKPQPIKVKIGKADYEKVLSDVQKKYPRYNHNSIPLIASSVSMPIVVIKLEE